MTDTVMWRADGECRKYDPEIFNASPNERRSKRTDRARQVCDSCKVLDKCTEFVAMNPQPVGVWAGLLPLEQMALSGIVRRHDGQQADSTG